MTLSSPTDFEASKIGHDDSLVRSKRNGFLDEFFAHLSPVTGLVERVVRNILLRLQPEIAHNLTLAFLPIAAVRYRTWLEDDRLRQRVFGINFPNPVGVAAGVDKDAERVSALLNCGFGSVEVGTVTPFSQPGNESPRVFRFKEYGAIINRFGFNSAGSDAVLKRLVARTLEPGIVGVNIGANKDSLDRVSDYVDLIEKFALVADYITINVSSPNTPGLRSLQAEAALDDLLSQVLDARNRVQERAGPTPILLKIAPDVSLSDLDDIVGVARRRRIDGMIVSNTTISRPSTFAHPDRKEVGGLSGRPLFDISTRILAETYVRVEGAFPLIGVGGVDSGEAALAKIRAGANLVQLYSGLAFHGLDLIERIKKALISGVVGSGVESIKDLVGADAAALTAEAWPPT